MYPTSKCTEPVPLTGVVVLVNLQGWTVQKLSQSASTPQLQLAANFIQLHSTSTSDSFVVYRTNVIVLLMLSCLN